MSRKIIVRCENNYHSVFAQENIAAGELIFSCEECLLVSMPSRYSVQVGVEQHIDLPLEREDEAIYQWKFMNHGCQPNVAFDVVSWQFRAARDIRMGEQLRFNYNTTEYQMAEPFFCNCNDLKCYGQIAGFKYLSEEQRENIEPYIAEHLCAVSEESCSSG